mmetsp:Transcript_6386/g.17818  ORF Transcript_6386/g.17818 Transcript_6386/m.17818 type:complete len:321 (-) Transcript_6386:3699-4661(-)
MEWDSSSTRLRHLRTLVCITSPSRLICRSMLSNPSGLRSSRAIIANTRCPHLVKEHQRQTARLRTTLNHIRPLLLSPLRRSSIITSRAVPTLRPSKDLDSLQSPSLLICTISLTARCIPTEKPIPLLVCSTVSSSRLGRQFSPWQSTRICSQPTMAVPDREREVRPICRNPPSTRPRSRILRSQRMERPRSIRSIRSIRTRTNNSRREIRPPAMVRPVSRCHLLDRWPLFCPPRHSSLPGQMDSSLILSQTSTTLRSRLSLLITSPVSRLSALRQSPRLRSRALPGGRNPSRMIRLARMERKPNHCRAFLNRISIMLVSP